MYTDRNPKLIVNGNFYITHNMNELSILHYKLNESKDKSVHFFNRSVINIIGPICLQGLFNTLKKSNNSIQPSKFVIGYPSFSKWKIRTNYTSFLYTLHDPHSQLVEPQKLTKGIKLSPIFCILASGHHIIFIDGYPWMYSCL